MLVILKKITSSEDRKRLIENFLSLSGLQIFTYILPLITLPYLVRVLGIEKYGLVMFAQAFIMFFNILVDYGFNLSATRELAVSRDNKDKVTEIYSSVMTIKVLLLVFSFFVLSIIVSCFERFRPDASLYLVTFLAVVGQALFPVWYFQGMERMKYITIINILSRVIFTVAIFVFVKNESHYMFVPILNGLGVCVGSFYALWLIKSRFKQKFKFQNLKNILYYFKSSAQFFLSRVSASTYTSANLVVLGLATNNLMVGYYSVAEKLYTAIQGMYGPVAQSLYPYIAKGRNISLFKTIFFVVVCLNFFGVAVLFFVGELVFGVLFGVDYGAESVKVFYILLIASLIVVPSIMIGHPLLGAMGYVNYANWSVIFASLFHVVGLLFLLLVDAINIYSVSIMVVVTEFFNFSYRVYGVKVSGILKPSGG